MTVDERNKLIEENFQLLLAACNRLRERYSDQDPDELMGIVFEAAIRAADQWNPSRGKYSTFLYWCARKDAYKQFIQLGKNCKRRSADVFSLDDPLIDGEGNRFRLADTLIDETIDIPGDTLCKMRAKRADEKQPQDVPFVRMRIAGYDYKEIGAAFGVSWQRARQHVDRWYKCYQRS